LKEFTVAINWSSTSFAKTLIRRETESFDIGMAIIFLIDGSPKTSRHASIMAGMIRSSPVVNGLLHFKIRNGMRNYALSAA
jgi:hypothetical protein